MLHQRRRGITLLNLTEKLDYLRFEFAPYVHAKFRSKPAFSLPPMSFFLKENMTDTSFIDLKKRVIKICIDPALKIEQQWTEALGLVIHENLHDIADIVPPGQQWSSQKFHLMNIFMDGRNEQFALSKDELCYEHLVKFREIRWKSLLKVSKAKDWVGASPNLMWDVAYATLRIHTGMMAKKPSLVKSFQDGEVSSEKFLKEVKKTLKLSIPSELEELFGEAWRITCELWLTGNTFIKSSLVDEFIELFPDPPEEDQNSASRPEAGDSHEGEPGDGDPEDGDPEDGEGQGGPGNPEKPSPGPGADPAPDFGNNEVPKPTTVPSAEDVERDLAQQLARPKSGSPFGHGNAVTPVDGSMLMEAARPFINPLKVALKQLVAPSVRDLPQQSSRINMRKVLRDPYTNDPWKRKRERVFDQNTVAIEVVVDVSGSMTWEGKLPAMQMAAAVLHGAMTGSKDIRYRFSTSVGLQVVADNTMKADRGYNLIQGISPSGGDGFIQSLPILFKSITVEKPLVIIFTDGQPGAIGVIAEAIKQLRKRTKAQVIGVGLNIEDLSDKDGMLKIFGEGNYLLSEIRGDAGRFVQQMSDLLRQLVRKRLRS